MKKTVIAVLCCLPLLSYASAEWGYSGDNGPNHWGSEFAECSQGKNQSPINITHPLKTELQPLTLHFSQTEQKIVNNGHTIQVNTATGNTLVFDKEQYQLQQFHFHAPSENQINGKTFPMEMHLVYKNNQNALAVVAVMFKLGKTNKSLADAWAQLPMQKGQEYTLIKPANIANLLPKSHAFYRFSGSLTTPPCSEGVTWLVLQKPMTLSTDQLKAFQQAIPFHNNRPTQPLDGRIIVD